MYARRRILAILVVLLLIALLVPRTCQALLGSSEDAGSSQDRQAGTVGAANEDGAQEGDLEEGATEDAGNADAGDADAGNADAGGTGAGGTDAEKSEGDDRSEGDDPSSRGAPFVDDEPGDGGASGTEDGDEAAPDLAAMMTELAVIGGEIPAAGDGQSSGAGAPSPPGTGGEPPADEHPISETQFALAASPTPAEQPANTRRAPSTESEPAERTAAPRAKAKRAPRAAEWASGRLDLTPPTLAVSRAGPEVRGARRTRIEPVLAEPAEPVLAEPAEPVLAEPAEPVLAEPAEPVLAEPAEPVLAEPPAPIPDDRAFVGNPRSGVARGVPRGVANTNNFGGNAAGALHGAPAFDRAVAAPRLPAVPRAAPAAATWGAGAAATRGAGVAAAARPVAF